MSDLENKMSPMHAAQQQQNEQSQNELTNEKRNGGCNNNATSTVVTDSGIDSAESISSLTRVSSTNDVSKTNVTTKPTNDTISAAADSSDNQILEQKNTINNEPQQQQQQNNNNNTQYSEHMQQQIYAPPSTTTALALMYQNNLYPTTNADENQQNYINYYNNYNENYYQQQQQQQQHQHQTSSLYAPTNNLRYNPYTIPIPTTTTPTANIINEETKTKVLSPSLVSSSSPGIVVAPPQPPPTNLSPNKWQCKKCGIATISENDLHEHVTNVHGSSPYGSSSGYSSSPFIKEETTNSNATSTICNLSNILDLDSQKMVYANAQQQQQQQQQHNQTIGPLIQQHLINDPLHSMHTMQQRQLPIWEQHQQRNNFYDTTPNRDELLTNIKSECTTDYVEQLENSEKLTISNSPTEFPTTTSSTDTNLLETQQQSTRNLEPPTSSSSVSGNIGSKSATWKSNEARRPKTYNCTACNKWFTSSGHLKRHYNTTLHKNAVKSSNQPDPATLPISVHHHPSRDPNSKHNRRNNNTANIKQQKPPLISPTTPTTMNQQATSFIPIQMPNNVDVNNFTNGHPNALAGPSDQITTTITTTSSNMRGLLNNNNSQQIIIKVEQEEMEEEEEQTLQEQHQQTTEKLQSMEKQQQEVEYQHQLLVQEYQERQQQEQQQQQLHYNQQQEQIQSPPPPHIIYHQPYLLEPTTQQQSAQHIMNSSFFCREPGIQHLPMLANNLMEHRICSNSSNNSNHSNNNMHMDIHTPNNNMQLLPITHIATTRHMEQEAQQQPQLLSQQVQEDIMLDNNNRQLIQQPLTTQMKILSATMLVQGQDVGVEQEQQTIQLQYIHNNTLHNNISAHNNMAISCHTTTTTTNSTITNINRHSTITQPPQLQPQQQRRLPITTPMLTPTHTPIIQCFQHLQQQAASTLIPLEPTMTYHTIIGNHHQSQQQSQLQQTELTALDTFPSQQQSQAHQEPQFIQTTDGHILQLIQGATTYSLTDSYTPISIRDERRSPQEADLPPVSKNQQETAVLRNCSPTISSSSWSKEEHPNVIESNIAKRKSNYVDSSITTTNIPPTKRKRLNNKNTTKNETKNLTTQPTSYITNNGRIKCLECDKEFTKICYLTQHNKSFHSGEYPFRCEKCGKRFQAEDVYTVHVGRHKSQDKPHKCDICPKQFHHKTDLRRHVEAIHTGLKQHACHLCEKSFCRQDHLRKHIETHARARSTDATKKLNSALTANIRKKINEDVNVDIEHKNIQIEYNEYIVVHDSSLNLDGEENDTVC